MKKNTRKQILGCSTAVIFMADRGMRGKPEAGDRGGTLELKPA